MTKEEQSRLIKTFANTAGLMLMSMREQFPEELRNQLEIASQAGYVTELSFSGWEDGVYFINYVMRRAEHERIHVATIPINQAREN